LPTVPVLGVPVTAGALEDQVDRILTWASKRVARYVCVANVHMVMEAQRDPDFAEVLFGADMVTPDGMPLVWLMRKEGARAQERVAGFDVLTGLCRGAQARRVGLYFLGSTDTVLAAMRDRLEREFPDLPIAGMQALPFRPSTPEEDAALIDEIHASGAGVVMLSLGCPKQERWMHEHRAALRAVTVGLGGAFPVYAGLQLRAPKWAREAGLEWAFRLVQEPGRLWHRYWSTNVPFLWLAFRHHFRRSLDPSSAPPAV
jgi:N-acetylglucosaminyldiphosphoundecaprenol N-acetyl-beta-D-mannosaminyltransferase